MKRKTVTLLLLLAVLTTPALAQTGAETTLNAQRKFQILVTNEDKTAAIDECNQRLAQLQEKTRGLATRGLLGDLIWQGVTSSFKQKTVNATSNLVSFGLEYLTDKVKSHRKQWYQRATQQCYYNQPLSSQSRIDDFYALPSVKGALDPENLKFKGFGCRNYIEVIGSPGEGRDVFYVFCKLRRDETGLNHIINHTKFLVELDSLYVDPSYCNLPNDSTGYIGNRFSFEKRDGLTLNLKVRIYSSWMNQATMIVNDQLLGEFSIEAQIDKDKLDKDGRFIYKKDDPDFDSLVSVEGDCFIVPRSFTGTMDAQNYEPTWGTGQYRIEMEVSESCYIVDSYYQVTESGKGQAVAFADGTKGKRKWDKEKWLTEWKSMKSLRKEDSFWKNAWKCVTSAYKGSGWMATLTDPLTTALYSYETSKLDDVFDDLYNKIKGDEDADAQPAKPSKN